MPISVRCTCGKQYKAPDNLQGKSLKCPNCGAAIVVPAGGAAQTQQQANPAAGFPAITNPMPDAAGAGPLGLPPLSSGMPGMQGFPNAGQPQMPGMAGYTAGGYPNAGFAGGAPAMLGQNMLPMGYPGMQHPMMPGMQSHMMPGMQPQMYPGMQQQMLPGMQVPQFPGGATASKKTKPWVWVLAGVGALAVSLGAVGVTLYVLDRANNPVRPNADGVGQFDAPPPGNELENIEATVGGCMLTFPRRFRMSSMPGGENRAGTASLDGASWTAENPENLCTAMVAFKNYHNITPSPDVVARDLEGISNRLKAEIASQFEWQDTEETFGGTTWKHRAGQGKGPNGVGVVHLHTFSAVHNNASISMVLLAIDKDGQNFDNLELALNALRGIEFP